MTRPYATIWEQQLLDYIDRYGDEYGEVDIAEARRALGTAWFAAVADAEERGTVYWTSVGGPWTGRGRIRCQRRPTR